MTDKKTSKKINFETSLKALEDIVNNMESQTLSLEEALTQFEAGIRLAKQCQVTLQNAKQRVEKLIDEKGDTAQ